MTDPMSQPSVAKLVERINLLENALESILPYVATESIGCHGYKCRRSWCWSCYGEYAADEAATNALTLHRQASEILKDKD